ncbi:MAG: hypothetical protein U0X20_27505 [Caldilineaceae bacterium]
MGPYDEFDPETGESRATVWRRQAAERNFVAPLPAPLATRPQTVDVTPWMAQTTALDTSRAWEPLQGAREATSAMDRAKALRVRMVPFLLAWGAISAVVFGVFWLVAGVAPFGVLLGALTFAGMTAITYARLNGQDYEYSREGTERHRVDTAADLQREQMQNDQELKRMALESYLRQMEGRNK